MNTQTYRIEEAARILGIGRTSVYAAVKRGDITSIRIGKLLRIPKPALDAMLRGEGQTAKTASV